MSGLAFKAGFAATVVWLLLPRGAGAQEPDDLSAPPVTESPAGEGDPLVLEQQRIAEKFRHLEELLARMAELTAVGDPNRAALLKKALGQSRERLIAAQLESILELLAKENHSRAIENQEAVQGELQALLELLLSENRARRIESEKARLRKYLKEVNRIIKQEKSLQGRTAGSGDPQRLAEEQGELARQTGNLAEDIRRNEGSSSSSGEAESGESPREDGEPEDEEAEEKGPPIAESPEQKDAGGEPAAGGSSDPRRASEPSQTEGGAGENSQTADQPEGEKSGQRGGQAPSGSRKQEGGSPQDQTPGQPADQAPAQEQHPAGQRIEAARERMREAQEKLRQAEREGALDRQEEAVRELEQAKAELEEILRQLREEEIERALAVLEQRFLKMLAMQREVYEGTQRLDQVPQAERDRSHEIEAGRLSSREGDIVLEADKALNLLREDGSAVAFPEAIEQMRADMAQVVDRLARAEVGEITQAVEEDIIAALEEMVEAVRKAIQDAEQRRQPPPGAPAGQPEDPALVDVLAELKMIRALQMRVNRRTERYSKLIDGEEATNADLLEALDRLADRQQRIFRVTRDLQLGRNQ